MVCFRFCVLISKLKSFEKICSIIQFTSPKKRKRHAVLLGIIDETTTMKISVCLGVNLKKMQMIRKELNESDGDYEGMVSRKPHSGVCDSHK